MDQLTLSHHTVVASHVQQIAVQFFVEADLLCTRLTAAQRRQAWV